MLISTIKHFWKYSTVRHRKKYGVLKTKIFVFLSQSIRLSILRLIKRIKEVHQKYLDITNKILYYVYILISDYKNNQLNGTPNAK